MLFAIATSAIASPQRVVFKTSPELINKSKSLLFGDLGKTEKGQNRGEHIKKYANAVYGKPIEGFPYCYAFQYWAVDSASKALKMVNPLPRTGHCNTAFNECLKDGTIVAFSLKNDDIIIFRAGNGSGHACRINRILNARDMVVETIEGNTSSNSAGSQRDGGGIYIKKRYLRHPLGRMNFRGVIGLNG